MQTLTPTQPMPEEAELDAKFAELLVRILNPVFMIFNSKIFGDFQNHVVNASFSSAAGRAGLDPAQPCRNDGPACRKEVADLL